MKTQFTVGQASRLSQTSNSPLERKTAIQKMETGASGGGFQFTATAGASGLQTFLIQATTNPADPNSWVQIGSLLPTTNPFTFIDTNAAQYPTRYYRIVAP